MRTIRNENHKHFRGLGAWNSSLHQSIHFIPSIFLILALSCSHHDTTQSNVSKIRDRITEFSDRTLSVNVEVDEEDPQNLNFCLIASKSPQVKLTSKSIFIFFDNLFFWMIQPVESFQLLPHHLTSFRRWSRTIIYSNRINRNGMKCKQTWVDPTSGLINHGFIKQLYHISLDIGNMVARITDLHDGLSINRWSDSWRKVSVHSR